MKFHLPALCLAGALVASAAWADHTAEHSRMQDRKAAIHSDAHMDRHGYYVYAGEALYFRQVFYPDLVPEREVATKLGEIMNKQRTELAHLTAFADRARTVGFTNIPTVYEYMTNDHNRLVGFCSNWLSERDYPLPPEPSAGAVNVSMSAPETVDHMLAMHIESFNESINRLRSERSSTVRGALLMAATTANRHISLLRLLDRDVEAGRRSLSAMLRADLEGATLAMNTEIWARIVEEEGFTIAANTPTTPVVQYIEKETVVEVPVPAPTPVVTTPAPVPTTVTITPPPAPSVIVNRPPARPARVAGQRQTRSRRPSR
jgi:hypothetical protein